MTIPRVRLAVSVDGLPEHHDVRRKPATYDRVLQNIAGCPVNIHWTITASMLGRSVGYPKLLMKRGIARAIESPPAEPSECMFSRMSTNYSADLETRVEPCIFGGTPDCSRCGCAISSGLHWLKKVRVGRLVKIETLVDHSVELGSVLGKLRREYRAHPRWTGPYTSGNKLVQIEARARSEGVSRTLS